MKWDACLYCLLWNAMAGRSIRMQRRLCSYCACIDGQNFSYLFAAWSPFVSQLAFSSSSGLFGVPGQSTYAAGKIWMNFFGASTRFGHENHNILAESAAGNTFVDAVMPSIQWGGAGHWRRRAQMRFLSFLVLCENLRSLNFIHTMSTGWGETGMVEDLGIESSAQYYPKSSPYCKACKTGVSAWIWKAPRHEKVLKRTYDKLQGCDFRYWYIVIFQKSSWTRPWSCERPLPGEHFVPVSDGLECFGRILDAEAGGVGFPHFLHRFVPRFFRGFGGGGLGPPKTEDPVVWRSKLCRWRFWMCSLAFSRQFSTNFSYHTVTMELIANMLELEDSDWLATIDFDLLTNSHEDQGIGPSSDTRRPSLHQMIRCWRPSKWRSLGQVQIIWNRPRLSMSCEASEICNKNLYIRLHGTARLTLNNLTSFDPSFQFRWIDLASIKIFKTWQDQVGVWILGWAFLICHHLSVSGNIRHFRFFVSRCGPWALLEAVIEAVVRAWSSVSNTWSAASQRLGRKMCFVLKSVFPKSFRTQKSTLNFLMFDFFLKIFFSMASDIRCTVDIAFMRRAPSFALKSLPRSCPAPLCWLWPWKSRPNSWARRWSNCRSFSLAVNLHQTSAKG